MGIVQALPCCEEKVILVCIIAAPHLSLYSFGGTLHSSAKSFSTSMRLSVEVAI